LTTGSSCTEHIYTQTIHRTTQSTQNNRQNNTIHSLGIARAVPRLCVVYPGICLTTEEKAGKNLSQGREQNMRSKVQEMGVCFHKGSVLGNMGGPSIPRAFDLRVSFFLIKRPIHSQLKWAILLCDVIPDGNTE
jgi:hypothetical protein